MKVEIGVGGLFVSDEHAYDVMKDLLSRGDDVTIYSSNLVHALRLLVLERYVLPDELTIMRESVEYRLNEYGNFEEWPEWLFGAPDCLVFRILRLQRNMG